jgi:hypothetical protein
MLDAKLTPRWIHFAPDPQGRQLVRPYTPAIELRCALESALLHRRPAAIFIDEAQHLTRMSSGRRVADQLEVIKSLASCTRTTHVLLGTYDLLTLRHLNGQLGRRSQDIHFRRYRAECAEDVRIFKNALLTFQKHLPLSDPPDLIAQWELLYERSVGCVGILKEWLERALVTALKDGSETLKGKHLESTALSATQCEKIVLEAHEGEKLLLAADQARPRLRALLGLEKAPDRSPVNTLHHQKRVGLRKPARDRIGDTSTSSRSAHCGV